MCWCSLPTKALSNYDYYMDTHRLRISVSNMKNANTREELELIKATVLKNLSDLDAAPSAQLAPRPPAFVKVGRVPSSLLHSLIPLSRHANKGSHYAKQSSYVSSRAQAACPM